MRQDKRHRRKKDVEAAVRTLIAGNNAWAKNEEYHEAQRARGRAAWPAARPQVPKLRLPRTDTPRRNRGYQAIAQSAPVTAGGAPCQQHPQSRTQQSSVPEEGVLSTDSDDEDIREHARRQQQESLPAESQILLVEKMQVEE